MQGSIIATVLLLAVGCTGQIPPLSDMISSGPHVIKAESTPALAQVTKFQERQRYNLLVRTVKGARLEETVGQHYGGFPEKVVYSYIGDRLSHEVVTEKLHNALQASGFQISQGWGGGGDPNLQLQSELLKYAVYSRGGFRNQNTAANVSIKVRLLDLRSQQTIIEDIISKSQTVTSTSPELLNTVVDQTVVAIANHPALTQGLGVPRPPPETVTVEARPPRPDPGSTKPKDQGQGTRPSGPPHLRPKSPAKGKNGPSSWGLVGIRGQGSAGWNIPGTMRRGFMII
jgi:hypothetical protein